MEESQKQKQEAEQMIFLMDKMIRMINCVKHLEDLCQLQVVLNNTIHLKKTHLEKKKRATENNLEAAKRNKATREPIPYQGGLK